MAEFPFKPPSQLTAEHKTESFKCKKEPLNEFLHSYALVNSKAGSAQTFVVADAENNVVAYYSLAAASIKHDEAHSRVKAGQPRHDIPAILLARLAVDERHEGKGIGKALFRDALIRALAITENLGARVLVIDAKDDEALGFYSKYKTMASPVDPYRLYLLFKDVRKIIGD